MRKIRRGLWFDGKRKARMEVTIPHTGRRRRRLVDVATRADAEATFKAFRDDVLNHDDAGLPRSETLEAYVRRNWPISRDRRRPISAATARREWCSLTVHVFPALGALSPSQITENAVEDFAAHLLKLGHKNSSVNDRMRTLHKLCVHAERRGGHTVPALRRWPSPLPEQRVRQELNPQEAQRFLAAFNAAIIAGAAGGEGASRYYTALFRWSKPLFTCAIHLGLARSDLLTLRWSSIDLKRGLVIVERKKTGISAVIPLSRAARGALMTCRSRVPVDAEFVFVTPDGRPYSDATWRRYFAVAKRHAGISRPFRPHDLRHTFGSLLRSKGVDLSLIQRAMGHADYRTTERYASVRVDALKPIKKALDRLN